MFPIISTMLAYCTSIVIPAEAFGV